MPSTPFNQRLQSALPADISPAELARRVGCSEAAISIWLNDKVNPDHVKASMLLKISAELGVNPYWLLFNQGPQSPTARLAEPGPSHPLKLDQLKVALQLTSEALDSQKLTLPPEKRADLTALIYELLDEGLPEAKVLRFARAAAA